MNFDPHSVMKLLGLESVGIYPIAVSCPCCGHADKLEIRSPLQATCRNCHFVGDLVELLAEVRGQSLEDVVDELRQTGVMAAEDPDVSEYLTSRGKQRDLRRLWRNGAEKLSRSVPPSIMAILSDVNARFGAKAVSGLVPHICALRADEFSWDSLPDLQANKEVKRWWKKYSAVGIPCWDGADLTGFWLIGLKGSRFLQTAAPKQLYAAGFGLTPSIGGDATIIVDDPVFALRMQLWSIVETSKPSGVVCPYGVVDNVATMQARQVVYWSPRGHTQHYARASRVPAARTIDHTTFGDDFDPAVHLPANNSYGMFCRAVNQARPAAEALAAHLLRTPFDSAKASLSGYTLDPSDRAKIIAFAQGDDAKYLTRLLTSEVPNEAVTWDGAVITDTDEGWVANGKLISSVKLYIDQIRPQGDTGDATLVGTLTYVPPGGGERVSLPFRAPLSTMRKNPGEWATGRFIAKLGHIPFVDSKWSKKLLDIAQRFHVPTPVMADQQYGWGDNKLRMPNFVVDSNNVYLAQSILDGPGLPIPLPLSSGEWAAFRTTGFCRIFLALMGNLIRTQQGAPGVGIMLTNEPHVISRLASTFAARVANNPSAEELDLHQKDPLPLFTNWTQTALGKCLATGAGYRNITLSVDSRTASLSRLSPDWLRVTVGESIDFDALRAIFLLLPHVIRNSCIHPDSDTFYRELADVLATEVGNHCDRHRLATASRELDTHSSYRLETAATRILGMVLEGVAAGEIEPEYTDDSVLVVKEQFVRYTANPVVPIPSLSELTQRLVDSRFTKSSDPRSRKWEFNRTTWDINASLAGVSS